MYNQTNNFDGINRKTKRNKTSFIQKFFVYAVAVAVFYALIVAFVWIATPRFEKFCEINQGRGNINCLFSENY